MRSEKDERRVVEIRTIPGLQKARGPGHLFTKEEFATRYSPPARPQIGN